MLATWLLLVALFAWSYLIAPEPGASPASLRLLLVIGLLIGPLWAFLGSFRRHPIRWPRLTALLASFILFVAWLTHDDKEIRHPEWPALLQTELPHAAESHALTLRYTHSPLNQEPSSTQPSTLPFNGSPGTPEQNPKWIEFVSAHHEDIQAEWLRYTPLRAWFEEMADYPDLADLTTHFSDPIISFRPLRDYSRVACAQATWLILSNQPSEALAIILPVYQVGYKIEKHARTLVRRMVGIVIQRQTLATLSLLLDHTEAASASLPPSTLTALAQALAPPYDPVEQARLLALSEFHLTSEFLRFRPSLADSLTWFGTPASRLSVLAHHFAYLPRSTTNLLGDYMYALADHLALRTPPETFAQTTSHFLHQPSLPRFRRNAIGHRYLHLITPAYEKIGQSFWEVQDHRYALLQRTLALTQALP